MLNKIIEKLKKFVYELFGISESEVFLNKYKNKYENYVARYSSAKARNESKQEEVKQVKENLRLLKEAARKAGKNSDEETVRKCVIAIKTEESKRELLEKTIAETDQVLEKLLNNINQAATKISTAEGAIQCAELRRDLAELRKEVGHCLASSRTGLVFDVKNVEEKARAAEIENEVTEVDGGTQDILSEIESMKVDESIEKEVKKYMR